MLSPRSSGNSPEGQPGPEYSYLEPRLPSEVTTHRRVDRSCGWQTPAFPGSRTLPTAPAHSRARRSEIPKSVPPPAATVLCSPRLGWFGDPPRRALRVHTVSVRPRPARLGPPPPGACKSSARFGGCPTKVGCSGAALLARRVHRGAPQPLPRASVARFDDTAPGRQRGISWGKVAMPVCRSPRIPNRGPHIPTHRDRTPCDRRPAMTCPIMTLPAARVGRRAGRSQRGEPSQQAGGKWPRAAAAKESTEHRDGGVAREGTDCGRGVHTGGIASLEGASGEGSRTGRLGAVGSES
eukprot:gene12643-biopygen9927